MSSQVAKDPTPEKQPGMPPIPPPPGADVEAAGEKGSTVEPTETVVRPDSNFRGLSNVQQWKKAGRMARGVVVMRALALLFSFLSFIIMVTNVRGYYLDSSVNFSSYQEFNFVLAIAVLTMIYSMVQTGIKIHQLRTGKQVISPNTAALVDFIGDQIMAYMLLSSASAASPKVVGLKQNFVDPFIDQSAAAISMSFLAFFSLAPAALISGYSLSIQSYK